MTKPSLPTADVLLAYTTTPATAKSIAATYGVSHAAITAILKAGLTHDQHEKLKIRKNSVNHIRANLIRYRAQLEANHD